MNIIETSRTVLRKLTMNDLNDLAAMFSNPRVMKYLGLNGQPVSKAETRELLESMIRFWQVKGYGRMAVISRQTDKLIGIAGLRCYEGDAEIFYLLDEPYWGKGLATEIGNAILEYGFRKFDFPRIIAVTRPANAATLKVLDKIGLKFIKKDVVQGVRAFKFAVTREDFQSNNTRSQPYHVKSLAAGEFLFGY